MFGHFSTLWMKGLIMSETVDRRCSAEKLLKNFPKFIGKQLCQSHFLSKVSGCRPTTLLQKDSITGVFE